VLTASIGHFSLWGWVKKFVLGVSGEKPNCGGAAPSWATVRQTAAGEFGGIIGSCAGTGPNGSFKVLVQSDHNGYSEVTFQERPDRLVRSGLSAGITKTSGGWTTIVPKSLLVEADYNRPADRNEVVYGYGARSGATYFADAVFTLFTFIPGDAANVVANSVVDCYALIIAKIDNRASIDNVLDCLGPSLEKGLEKVTTQTLASRGVSAAKDLVRKVSFWKNVAFAARDAGIAFFNHGALPTAVDATLQRSPPPPPPPPGGSPPPTVTVGAGSAVTIPSCTDAACAFVTVTLSDFPAGTHTVECLSDDPFGPPPPWYSYTTTVTTSAVCVYGYPGYHVWTKVDGTYESNHFLWSGPGGTSSGAGPV
jgi:hypothetical protein